MIPDVYIHEDDLTSKIVDKWNDRKKGHSIGPWGIIQKVDNFPVYIPEEEKFIFRTAYPMAPFGPWSVYKFKYKGKYHSSLVDDIWGYLTKGKE